MDFIHELILESDDVIKYHFLLIEGQDILNELIQSHDHSDCFMGFR